MANICGQVERTAHAVRVCWRGMNQATMNQAPAGAQEARTASSAAAGAPRHKAAMTDTKRQAEAEADFRRRFKMSRWTTKDGDDWQRDPFVKPPHSQAMLIFMAMKHYGVVKNGGKIDVAQIHSFITGHFDYFRDTNAGWKNSILSNLTAHACFLEDCSDTDGGAARRWSMTASSEPTCERWFSAMFNSSTPARTLMRPRGRTQQGVVYDQICGMWIDVDEQSATETNEKTNLQRWGAADHDALRRLIQICPDRKSTSWQGIADMLRDETGIQRSADSVKKHNWRLVKKAEAQIFQNKAVMQCEPAAAVAAASEPTFMTTSVTSSPTPGGTSTLRDFGGLRTEEVRTKQSTKHACKNLLGSKRRPNQAAATIGNGSKQPAARFATPPSPDPLSPEALLFKVEYGESWNTASDEVLQKIVADTPIRTPNKEAWIAVHKQFCSKTGQVRSVGSINKRWLRISQQQASPFKVTRSRIMLPAIARKVGGNRSQRSRQTDNQSRGGQGRFA